MTEAWKRLQSGTDIRGMAVGEAGSPPALTGAVGEAVGTAFARWLAEKAGKPAAGLTVAVGRDSRVTGDALLQALARGLRREPLRVLDCGLCTTPAMFMTTVLAGCDGAVMVTASHMPWRQNGYKFFTPEGGLDGGDVTEILERAEGISAPATGTEKEGALPGGMESLDFLSVYADFLGDRAIKALGGPAPLDGLKIVVDAGNGAGGFYASLLSGLGAGVAGSQFLTPDGRFPGHIPNPEAPEAMASLSAAVLAAGADLGVLFDADCDRAALVDAAGNPVNRNRLIALVAAVLLDETPGITVVTDSVVSAGLGNFLARRGGTLHRFKRGYRNVIGEARRLCAQGVDCPLAMETSGHAALRENHFLDDGMYLATRLIIEAARLRARGKTLDALVEDLREPVEAREARLPIVGENFRAVGEAALAAVTAKVEETPGWAIDAGNREGIRGLCGAPEEWFLLRLSLHDPLLVLNAESDRPGGVSAMLAILEGTLGAFPALDLAALIRARRESETNAASWNNP